MSDSAVQETNRQAREQALQAAAALTLEPTSLLEYRSQGRLLIIGSVDTALAAAERLGSGLQLGLIVRGSGRQESAYPVLAVAETELRLTGHLGQYQLELLRDGEWISIPPLLGWPRTEVDLILDLSESPLLDYEVKPFGYFATQGDPANLEQALAELPELTGEFEKAKYFAYDPAICAHGNSNLSGCQRCLDTCPTGAISSLIDKIQVNPYYCQGAGSCATACPTGAITYRYPSAADTLNRLRVLLRTYLQAGGQQPILLLHDNERGQQLLQALPALPSNILAMAVEELGSVGMEVWLGALAFGASRVVLLDTEQVPHSVRREINAQLETAWALLEGLAYPSAALIRVRFEGLAEALSAGVLMPSLQQTASYAGSNEKRNMLFFAIDWLRDQAEGAPETIALPPQAPFGRIEVNRDTCTLCMACVSVCPASAVTAAGDTPRLDFIEANCVQCGLCQKACPEDAVGLASRYLLDREHRLQRRTLNEETPFCCVACGKPFATQSVIEKMTAKLASHSMFQNEQALRRLQMCGDCRVRDMFEQDYR